MRRRSKKSYHDSRTTIGCLTDRWERRIQLSLRRRLRNSKPIVKCGGRRTTAGRADVRCKLRFVRVYSRVLRYKMPMKQQRLDSALFPALHANGRVGACGGPWMSHMWDLALCEKLINGLGCVLLGGGQLALNNEGKDSRGR
jgi:hypothetical protein